ncbi:DUF4190 domain-containing protein [Streptomyces sp. NPDC001828]|uniref:DUF4190 domain-containing protein n=1 Tax=Streptomyces sp. NPDC001828 TaxID=3364615 RepID=UPI0036A50E11
MTTPVVTPEPQPQPQWGPPSGDNPPPMDGYPSGWAPVPPRLSNGLGTAAIVLGSISSFVALLPGLFWVAWILGPLAVIFGLVGLHNVRKGRADNKSSALGGTILGGVSMALAIVGLVVTVTMVKDAINDDKQRRRAAVAEASPQAPATPLPAFHEVSDPGPAKYGESHTYDDGVTVTVAAPTEYTPGKRALGLEKGDRAFLVHITVTNHSTEPVDANFLQPRVKDANGAGVDFLLDTKAGMKLLQGELAPGDTAEGQYAFPVSPDAAHNFQVSLHPGILYSDAEWAGPLG